MCSTFKYLYYVHIANTSIKTNYNLKQEFSNFFALISADIFSADFFITTSFWRQTTQEGSASGSPLFTVLSNIHF